MLATSFGVYGTLKKLALTERTVIFFIGDNGAPLKIHKIDSPVAGDPGGWDGSLNDPLNGEKGMLTEGGMHVPFLIAWPGTIPGGQVFEHPVSALDVAATAAAQAGLTPQPGDLDGVNLIPHLTGELKPPPHDALYWRWTAQSAIREGRWKLLRGGEREYLYDLSADLGEKHNLAAKHPDIAQRLRARLKAWCDELHPPGLALAPMAQVWNDYFDHYLEGKTIAVPSANKTRASAGIQGWQARNSILSVKDGVLVLAPDAAAPKNARPFLTNADINLPGPITATLKLHAGQAGQGTLTWRTKEQKDFLPENTVTIAWTASPDFQLLRAEIPAQGSVIHIRLTPSRDSPAPEIQAIELRGKDGKVQIWNFKSAE